VHVSLRDILLMRVKYRFHLESASIASDGKPLSSLETSLDRSSYLSSKEQQTYAQVYARISTTEPTLIVWCVRWLLTAGPIVR